MAYCTAIKTLNGYEPLGDLANTAIDHSRNRAKEIARDFNSRAFRHIPSRAVVVPLPRVALSSAPEGGS